MKTTDNKITDVFKSHGLLWENKTQTEKMDTLEEELEKMNVVARNIKLSDEGKLSMAESFVFKTLGRTRIVDVEKFTKSIALSEREKNLLIQAPYTVRTVVKEKESYAKGEKIEFELILIEDVKSIEEIVDRQLENDSELLKELYPDLYMKKLFNQETEEDLAIRIQADLKVLIKKIGGSEKYKEKMQQLSCAVTEFLNVKR